MTRDHALGSFLEAYRAREAARSQYLRALAMNHWDGGSRAVESARRQVDSADALFVTRSEELGMSLDLHGLP